MSPGQVTLLAEGPDHGFRWRKEIAFAAFVEAILGCVLLVPWNEPYAIAYYSAAASAMRVVAIVCIARGLSRYRPLHRFVWILLLLRCAWSAAFIPLRSAYIANPFWWAVDIALGTLVYIVVAATLVASRASARDRSLWIDILVICMGAAFALFAYLGAPLLAKLGLSATTLLTGVVIPSLDVLLLALTLLLAFTWRDRNATLGMLIAAFVLVAFADVSVQLAQIEKLNLSALHSVPFGPIFTSLIGLSALHPSMRTMQSRARSGLESWGKPRTILIVAAFLLALGGLLIEPEGQGLPAVFVAGVLATMFLLIVWRAYLAVRSLAASRKRIHYLATHDSSTGLLNLMGLAETYARRLAGNAKGEALLLLRLTHLHEIGQLWGLALRDRWVARVAAALATATAQAGHLARVGSDQFALLADAPNSDAALLDRVAQRMAVAARDTQLGAEANIVSAFDIGIAQARSGSGLDALLRDAGSALSIAHAQGENRIAHYDPEVVAAERRRLALLTGLHGAVARNEFTLHYQPVVDMATYQVAFHEALLRWDAGELGEIPPAEFIPLAESIDAIEAITDWVLDTACAALAAASPNRAHGYRLSINISAHSLQRPGLAHRVIAVLERHRLSAGDLCLELTERVRVEDAHGELGRLRALGVALAIDDFGSGYSNLAMLARLSADTIKLDIDFVRAIEADASMRDLCASVLAQVSMRGAKVIAEGIETEAQHNLLRSLGCHYGQGWLYGRPLPWLDLTDHARRSA